MGRNDLERRFKKLGMPMSQFARLCDLSVNTIKSIFNGVRVREASVTRVENTLNRLEAEHRVPAEAAG